MRFIIAILLCSTSFLLAGEAFLYPTDDGEFKKVLSLCRSAGLPLPTTIFISAVV